LREVSATVRERAMRFRPSAELSRAVAANIRRVGRQGPAPVSRSRRVLALAAAILLAAVLVGALDLLSFGNGGDAVHQAVAVYRQSGAEGRRTEIASADRGILSGWAASGLGFAPPVADLGSAGFDLVGARRESVTGASAVALVYRRGDRFVDLIVVPAPGAPAYHARLNREDGVGVVDWTESGLRFLAVSDLDGDALMQFHKSVESAIQAP
jgi:anti-sigma factor RsiW